MKKLGRKALALSLSVVLGASMIFTGCGKDEDKEAEKKSPEEIGATNIIDQDTEGEVSVMVWSGDGQYYEDIGNPNSDAGKKLSDPKNIVASNVAQVYAVAQEFHKAYPNIKINLWSKEGDPDQYKTASWDQEMENFKAKYKKYPDIWASTNVPNDIESGLAADLSRYKDDALYQSYNQELMEYLNYYGFQGGLPSYVIPAGIWVNKSLASNNNIRVPNPDWTIDQYTTFISKFKSDKYFYGTKSIPAAIVNFGTTKVNRMIKEENKVDLNTAEVKALLEYVPKWSETTVDSAKGNKTITADVVKESNDYSWYYFTKQHTLTNYEDPWFLTTGADEDAKGTDAYINATDWDMYPYPSTDYTGNTVRLVMDPICLHNYAIDDDNKMEWSDEENKKLDVTYTFASFWTASTQAKEAINKQQWTDNGKLRASATGDSLPVVSGDAYKAQYEIWESLPAHQTYKDKEGFQLMLKIWQEEGGVIDYLDKSCKNWTRTVSEKGDTKDTLYEWINMGNEIVAGAWPGEDDWMNNVIARLDDWNETCNKRIQQATKELQDALVEIYGMDKSSFNK